MAMTSFKKAIAITAVSVTALFGAYKIGVSQRPSYQQLSPKVQQAIQDDLAGMKSLVARAFQEVGSGNLQKSLVTTREAMVLWGYIPQLIDVSKDKEYAGMKVRLAELGTVLNDTIFSQGSIDSYTRNFVGRYRSLPSDIERGVFINNYQAILHLPDSLRDPTIITTIEVQRLALQFRIRALQQTIDEVLLKLQGLSTSSDVENAIFSKKKDIQAMIFSSQIRLENLERRLK